MKPLESNKVIDLSKRQGRSGMESTQKVDIWGQKIKQIAVSRDKSLFAELFNHYAPLIKAYIYSSRLGGLSPEEADELVQEVMIKVWNKAEKFDSSLASANTWVFTIARNQRIDMLRKYSKFDAELQVDDVFPDVEDEGETPVTSIENRVIERKIREGLTTLPPEQKEVLEKVFLEDKTHQVASEELQLPLGTVKSRIRLALSKLKVVLESHTL